MQNYLWLIPVLPLIGFLINGLVGRRLPRHAVEAVAVLLPAASFVLSILAFLQLRKSGVVLQDGFSWMLAGEVSVDVALSVDGLSGIMILVVTGVGSLIHLYSVGYMHDDATPWRFFAYLNLFLFAMLVLVLGDSLPLLFVGWEGVGLCSYLLIGYWFKEMPNCDAGMKAFITNRIGDAGFLLGMFALFSLAQTLSFEGLRVALANANGSAAVVAGPFAGWTVGGVLKFATICLFVGATGKSAQIPLYVWLPDAMAGPTPVSALIHAATMVTAGIYMIARLNFLYTLVPGVLELVGLVAAATALLAGAIAVAQNDIKKVLAYSTVSQLGFMFCGLAAAAYTSGMFHLVTHAFFKALLFLGAGAVIHALKGEQDIRKMGGLAPQLRWTFLVFAVGGLALAGCYPLSGFYSKDSILAAVYLKYGHGPIWWMLVATAFLTAFYTTRLIMMVFFGQPRNHLHPHGPGWTMFAPLAVLAIFSAVGGALMGNLEAVLKPVWKWHAPHDEHAHHHAMMYSFVLFGLGASLGVLLYGPGRKALDAWTSNPLGAGLRRLAENKFYVDELYTWLVIVPLKTAASVTWFLVDKILIDTVLVGGSGKLVYLASGQLRRTHGGTVNAAAAGIVIGVLATLGFLIWKVFRG